MIVNNSYTMIPITPSDKKNLDIPCHVLKSHDDEVTTIKVLLKGGSIKELKFFPNEAKRIHYIIYRVLETGTTTKNISVLYPKKVYDEYKKKQNKNR
jgi:hypothetical protein